MAELTLEETVFLLSRDPTTGRDRASYGIDAALAGAVLIELARRGCVRVVDGRVSRENAPGPAVALHREALALVEADEGKRVRRWISRLPSTLHLQERIGVGLVEKGLLEDGRTRFLGVTQKKFPRTGPGDEVAAPLARAVTDALTGADPEPTEDVRLLATLLAAAELLNRYVERGDRKAARKRAKAWMADDAIGGAVRASVQATQAAIFAAISSSSSASGSAGQ